MNEEMTAWVFTSVHTSFPSAVFVEIAMAEEWIRHNALSGVLSRYPVNVSMYDWAIANEYFKPKTEKHTTSDFIGGFSSASQEHYHYQNGERRRGSEP